MINNELYSISTIAQKWGADENTTVYILNKFKIPEVTPGLFSISDIENKEMQLPDGLDTLFDAFNQSMEDLFDTINKNIEELGLGNQINVLENEYEDLIAKITGLKEKDDPELDELIRENEEILEEIKEEIEDIKKDAEELNFENTEEIDYVKKDRDREKIKEKINKAKSGLEYQDKYNQDYLFNNSTEEYIKTYEETTNNFEYNKYYEEERKIAEEIFNKSDQDKEIYLNNENYNNGYTPDTSHSYENTNYSENKNYEYAPSYEENANKARPTSEYDRMAEEERVYSYEDNYKPKEEIKLDKTEETGYTESSFHKSYKENQENINTYKPTEMAIPIMSGYSLSENDDYQYYIHGGKEYHADSVSKMAFVNLDDYNEDHEKNIHVISKQENGGYKVEKIDLNNQDPAATNKLYGVDVAVIGKDHYDQATQIDQSKRDSYIPIINNGDREVPQNDRHPYNNVDGVERSNQSSASAEGTNPKHAYVPIISNDDKRDFQKEYQQRNEASNANNLKYNADSKDEIDVSNKKKNKIDNPNYNVLKTQKLKSAMAEWRNTMVQVTGVEQSDAVRGYHKASLAFDTAKIPISIGAATAYNMIAAKQFKQVNQEAIKGILSRNNLLEKGKKFEFNVSSKKALRLTKNEYGKMVGDFCKANNLKDMSRMTPKEIKKYMSKIKLTGDAKELAETTMKLGRLRYGAKHFRISGKFIGVTKGLVKRIAGENDAVKTVLIAHGAFKSSKKAIKAVQSLKQNTLGVAAKTRGLINSNNVKLAEEWGKRATVLNKHGKVSKIRNNRTIFNIRHTGMHMRDRFVATKLGKGATTVFKGSKAFGAALKAKDIHGALTILKSGAAAIKTLSLNGIGAAAAVIAKPLVIIIAAIVLLFCVVMCCVIGMTALLNYNNNAFGTSNSLIKNIENLFSMGGETNATYGEGDDDVDSENDIAVDSGAVSDLEDSVGWFALKNDVGFYSVYEDVLEKSVEKYIKIESKTYQKATELDGNTPLKDYIYNNLETSYGEESPLGDKIVYYLSTNSLSEVLRDDKDYATIGSDYPYYNSQEILSMASAKLQSSINPYNYRRFSRILRNYSYAVDLNFFKKMDSWFRDVVGWKENISNEDFEINDKEIYLQEAIDTPLEQLAHNIINSVYSIFNLSNDYNDEMVYIGYRYLSDSEMETFGHGKYDAFWCKIYDLEPVREDRKEEFLEELETKIKEEYLCDNYMVVEVEPYSTYTPPQEHVFNGYRDIVDEDGEVIGQEPVYIDIPAKGRTVYYYYIYCMGHKTLQTYVRCATLKGHDNLYDLDDECEDEKNIFKKIKEFFFPDTEFKWADDQSDDSNKRGTVIELKSEAEDMASSNWPLTYGINWERVFDQAGVPDYYDTVGYRLSQGDGAMNEGDKKTPYGMVVDYIDKMKALMETGVVINENAMQLSDGRILTSEDASRIYLVDKAISYVGRIKYFYGATIPTLGVSDCSAYISEVLGINRTTTSGFIDDPSYTCYGQNYDAMKPGDLLITIGEGRGSHVRMYTGLSVNIEGTKYYITVECSSGATTRFYSSDKTSGCSCGRYSASDLSGSGYQVYSVENHLKISE